MANEIWTIGHWNHTEENFTSLLASQGIELLVDVRSVPGSRRSSQYGKEALSAWLPEAGVQYTHMPLLGGRRTKQDVDPLINSGWENKSFKSYADYTLSLDYKSGIHYLEALAQAQRVAYMCGEPMPWRCHRSIISNTMTYRGWEVHHIFPDGKTLEHELGMYGAKPHEDRSRGLLTYPMDAELVLF